MGTHATPQENTHIGAARRGPSLGLQIGGASAGGGSSDESVHSRTNSFGGNRANGSVSTNSSYDYVREILGNPSDPESAYSSASAHSVGMERENSMQAQNFLPDLEKLSLEKGRPLDVHDLDDTGWKAASKEGRILELGSLGEGAGGAVTRCKLQGGKTVFALKVRMACRTFYQCFLLTILLL